MMPTLFFFPIYNGISAQRSKNLCSPCLLVLGDKPPFVTHPSTDADLKVVIFVFLFLIACANAIIAAKTGNDMLGAMGWVLVAWLSVGMWQVDRIGSRPWGSECGDAGRAH